MSRLAIRSSTASYFQNRRPSRITYTGVECALAGVDQPPVGGDDERVADPENLTTEPWEVELLLAEGDKLIPGISQARVVRSWAGVRPLYADWQLQEMAQFAVNLVDALDRDEEYRRSNGNRKDA